MPGIGCHEQQERHQQLGLGLASPCEVRRLAATVQSPCRLEQLPDESHQRFVERCEYGAAGFGQRLACQVADDSLLPRRISFRLLPSAHLITVAKGRHAQPRSSRMRSDMWTNPRFPPTTFVALGRKRAVAQASAWE
jgi:hypothetical protein